MSDAAIAWNRFGYGGRPDAAPPANPRQWLHGQLDRYEPRPQAIAALPARSQIAAELGTYLREIRQNAAAARRTQAMAGTGNAAMAAGQQVATDNDPVASARRFARQQGRDYYAAAVGARVNLALTSETPFLERLTHFWANHFAVSADRLTVVGLAGWLEFEAVRPHLLGNFKDMLLAVERHPAMLLYLDQAQSIGPNSFFGQRAGMRLGPTGRRIGLNENLAREILELHTLGVRTGYSQADVTELARAMTGWSVRGMAPGPLGRMLGLDGTPGDFAFVQAVHEPGVRTVLGKRYTDDGAGQALAILGDLAVHPATARHIATKLARHFAGDDPPVAMVGRLEQAFARSRGDLPTVYRALIDSREAWVPAPLKFKTPWEWTVSALRATGARTAPPLRMVAILRQLGQGVWQPGSPAGFDDKAASWAGPDALVRRVEVADRIAQIGGAVTDARRLAEALHPGALSPATTRAIASAESPGQGLALMLVSPEFLRR